MNPPNRNFPIQATARNRPIVASVPLSQYENGLRAAAVDRPAVSAATTFPAYRPICSAAGATPGTLWPVSALLAAARSPTTNTCGYPGTVRSGLTITCPDLVVGTPRFP